MLIGALLTPRTKPQKWFKMLYIQKSFQPRSSLKETSKEQFARGLKQWITRLWKLLIFKTQCTVAQVHITSNLMSTRGCCYRSRYNFVHSKHRRLRSYFDFCFVCCKGILIVFRNEAASAQNMTTPHKATDQTEKERIESLGGHVFFGRVFGALAVSRSFGDAKYKMPKTSANFVSYEPAIQTETLLPCHR